MTRFEMKPFGNYAVIVGSENVYEMSGHENVRYLVTNLFRSVN